MKTKKLKDLMNKVLLPTTLELVNVTEKKKHRKRILPRNMTMLLVYVGIHYGIFGSFVLTSILGFVTLPWYVATTLLALIGRVIFSAQECPLTTFENRCRKKLGIPLSHGFLKDYLLQLPKTIKTLRGK